MSFENAQLFESTLSQSPHKRKRTATGGLNLRAHCEFLRDHAEDVGDVKHSRSRLNVSNLAGSSG